MEDHLQLKPTYKQNEAIRQKRINIYIKTRNNSKFKID